MLNLTITYKQSSHALSVDATQTVGHIKKAFEASNKIPVIQQELSQLKDGKKKVFQDDQMPLEVAGITAETQLTIKNLGKQIRWDYVFLVQYAGPLLIFPILYLLGDREHYGYVQTLALVMGVLHYAKREFETVFVHVFSRSSMPFKRLFINSIHYWVFFGLFNGIEIFLFPSQKQWFSLQLMLVFAAIWLIAEFCNFQCHLILSSFRKNKQKNDGDYDNASKRRGIPYGWGFNQVSCANYMWQTLGWLMFALITGAITSCLFLGLSAYQMAEWAAKKHKNYLTEFKDEYPKNRKAMIPMIY